MTREDLEKTAIRYLERFASSTAGVRRILANHVRRAGGEDGTEYRADPGAAIEAVIAKLVRLGLLDDARYAESRAASLARGGRSLFMIRHDLKSRGISGSLIDAAIARLKDEAGGTSDAADRVAATALARRRRIGPFRRAALRAAYRERDLAVLSRAGFALEVARAIVDGDSEDG